MASDAKFWNRLAVKYSKQPINDVPSYERKLEITRQYMNTETQVIEVGCGTGSTALLHAPYVKHILATDLSEKMIEIARNKIEVDQVDNVTFLNSSVEELKVTAPVDMVMAMSLLHLLRDKKSAIQHIYRWLKPGGVFVSTTVCLGEKLWIFKYLGPVGRAIGLLPVLDVFTIDQLKSCLLECGFEIDQQWRPGSGHSVFFVARKPES